MGCCVERLYLLNPCIEIEGSATVRAARLNWHKNRPKIPYCCLLLPRLFVTSVKSDRYGGSVWESNSNVRPPTHGE